MSENRVIGRDGQIPWRLGDDLKRFKRLTMGHPIIMGRKTYDSIGRALPGRLNVVLSRQPAPGDASRPGNVKVFCSLDDATIALAGEHDEAFVIGGQQVYEAALPIVDRVYLTLIHQQIEGDTFFPPLPPGRFTETSRQLHDEPIRHSYITLDRIAD